ncbi:MAG: D-sedoheptulose 7-phosphate isomerase [Dehalococcoidia bacterium]|nr:D-sedoheptulose 7-phosphate isomerase [Dehalococcoidia bacterium]
MIATTQDLIRAELLESVEAKRWVAENLVETIATAARMIENALRAGKKVLFAGNGGSAADSQHLACELVSRLARERAGLPAIALTTDTSILTAIGNDYGFEHVFRRQVEALGAPGDVLIVISTSGNSVDLLHAVDQARAKGMVTIGLLGRRGGALGPKVDLPVIVGHDNTQRIQECHIAIGHCICLAVENALFG